MTSKFYIRYMRPQQS